MTFILCEHNTPNAAQAIECGSLMARVSVRVVWRVAQDGLELLDYSRSAYEAIVSGKGNCDWWIRLAKEGHPNLAPGLTWCWRWLDFGERRRRRQNRHLNGTPLHIGGADALVQLSHYAQKPTVIRLPKASH